MVRVWLMALLAALVTAPGWADPAAEAAAIRQRFDVWTDAFNDGDAAGACDLFAPDLHYASPEILDGTRETMCTNLAKALARSDLRLHYDRPDIHEIVVTGDSAAVRLTWTLTTEAKGARDMTTEEGIDIFARQPDGRWSIVRFIAFTASPNDLLK